MDPSAALAILIDPTADPDDRAWAAAMLVEWVDRGGFTIAEFGPELAVTDPDLMVAVGIDPEQYPPGPSFEPGRPFTYRDLHDALVAA